MNSRPKVINISCYFDYAHERQRMAEIGADFICSKARTVGEVIDACRDAMVVLVEDNTILLDATVFDALPHCRAIVQYGIGVDHVDIAAATRCGIVVCHAADFCIEEVSDHAVALLLAGARQILAMDRRIRAGGWFDFERTGPLRRIASLTLGLVGWGRIARAVARKMSGFRMRVLATDPYVGALGVEPGVELVPAERLWREADLISIHVPLTRETRGLVGEAALRAMKPTALIVNTSRGPVIDQDSLVRALRERWIGGAALDVLSEEPMPASSPLRTLSNVILTPHYAGQSEESMAHLHKTVADSVEAILGGHWPPFPVNPSVRPRFPLTPAEKFRGA